MKITGVMALGAPYLVFDIGRGSVAVDMAWIEKHKPVIGGYYVRYADGYESFSPADAFEAGYTAIDG